MGKTILVVDDSETIRKLVSVSVRVLTGCTTVEAEDGLQAIEQLNQNAVDLVITDLRMPRLTGLELISYMKTDPKHQKTPIILLTTEASEEDRRKGLALGANEYLMKPFQPKQLQMTVLKHLGAS
jgi:two-component system chemotaxis response regulator CheY